MRTSIIFFSLALFLFSIFVTPVFATIEYFEAPTLPIDKLPEPVDTTGIFVHEFGIKTHPGRNNLQPDLKLIYSSQNRQGSEIIGYGWEFNIPYIERINRYGLDSMYTDDLFKSSLTGELENISSGSYGSKIDNGEFLDYAFASNMWTVTDKVGTEYKFGVATSTRQDDTSGSLVYKWMLEEIRDTNDNYISYEYYKDSGQIYPSKIIYTGNDTTDGVFEVEFLRELKTDQRESNSFGFSVQTKYRINEIQAKVNSTWEQKYALAYTTANNGVRSMLLSITETGKDYLGTSTSLPATTFDYQDSAETLTNDTSWSALNIIEASGSINVDTGNVFIDVNGDGYTDIFHADDDGDGTYYAKINDSDGTWTQDDNWVAPSSIQTENGVRFSDVNGDGLVDVVRGHMGDANSVITPLVNEVYLNDGTKWILDSERPHILDADQTGLDLTGDMSLEAWININDLPDNQEIIPIVYKGEGETNWAYTLGLGRQADADGGSVFLGYYTTSDGSDTGKIELQHNFTTATSTWYHVAATFKSSTREMNLYLDGTNVASSTAGSSFTVYNSSGPLTIGSGDSPKSYLDKEKSFTGEIDDVRVWGDVRTGTEISNNKDDELVGNESNLVGYWQFDNDLTDETSNSNNLNATNTPMYITDTGFATTSNSHSFSYENLWSLPVPFSAYTASASITQPDGSYFVDVNGDHLVDVIRIALDAHDDDGVYLNNGTGWEKSTTWDVPSTNFLVLHQSRIIDKGNRFIDVNGDGLTDIVKYWQSGGDDKDVFINDGDGTWTSDSTWTIPTSMSPTDNGLRFADINSDGLIDAIEARTTSGGSYKAVFINSGSNWVEDTGWTLPHTFINTTSGNSDKGGRLVDITGNGILDWYRGESGTTNIYTNNGLRPDLLSKITEDTGGTTEITYKASPKYKSGSTLLNPDLGLVIDTVQKITYNDGFGTTWSNTYEYRDGEYFFDTIDDRQFAGFGTIYKTDGLEYVTKSYYHQGNTTDTSNGEYSDDISKYGKSYREEIYDGSSNLYSKAINKWENYDLGNDRDFVKLTQKIDFSYDGDTDHKDKAETYTYSNTTGNMTAKTEYGEVTGADAGTFTDTGSDKRSTAVTYATGGDITGLLSKETITNQSSTKIKEDKYYYDSLGHGSVTTGNQTKHERWKSDTTYVDTEKTYNTYGLVTKDRDERNKDTDYIYDGYNLYVATSTNPLSQSTEFYYDYSSGKVKEVVDVNNRVFETIYDGLDRVLKEKQPDIDTPSTLVEKLVNTYTDTVGSRKIFTSNKLSSTISTDVYTYFDGFDRKIQERKEAEDTSTYSITDFVYNLVGSLEKESLPYFGTGSARSTATGSSNLYTQYTYDPSERIKTITTGLGVTTNTYDDWKTTITDALSNTKDLYNDAHGRLTEIDEHQATSTYSTTYEYNVIGNLTKITDADSNIRNFTYDGLGRQLTAQDLHDSADGTFGTLTYTYDDTSNRASKVDPKSQTVNFTYDDINRTSTEDYTGIAGTEISYGYDWCSEGEGRLCSATTTDAVTKYEYNALGGISKEIKEIGEDTFTTEFDYDRQGNQTQIIYPDTSDVLYTYNVAGLLEKIQYSAVGTTTYSTIVNDINHHSSEQKSFIQFGNDVESNYTYGTTTEYRLEEIDTQATTTAMRAKSIFGSVMNFVLGVKVAHAEEISIPEDKVKDLTRKGWNYISIPTFINSDDGGTQYSTEFHGKWINYKTTDSWEAIDTDFVETENGFEMVNAPFEVSLPKNSTGTAVMHNNNKWNVFTNKIIEEESLDLMIQAIDVKDVSGIIMRGDLIVPTGLQKNVSYVVYEGAYENGDLIYYVDFGEAPRLEKLVRINSKPTKYNYSFNISYSTDVDLISKKTKKSLSKEKSTKLDKKEKIKVHKKNSEIRGIGFKEFQVWDSNLSYINDVEIERNIRSIQVDIEPLDENSYILTKLLEESFFDENIVYPVYTDTTSTFYPDADTESTTVDGWVFGGRGSSWTTAHDRSGGGSFEEASDNSTSIYVNSVHNSTPYHDIRRGIFLFDTSSLPDGNAADSATLSLYVLGKVNTKNDTFDYMSIVNSTPASNTSLAIADTIEVGDAIDDPTKGATDIDLGSITASAYNVWTLNSTGKDWINFTGITKLGSREGHDVVDMEVGGTNWTNGLEISSADTSGTSQDPKLIVVHTVANSAPTAPTLLELDGETNPTGVSNTLPEFSAIYNDINSGDYATYYKLQVATSSDYWGSPHWDSAKTALTASTTVGTRSEDILYAGDSLVASTTYYWRAKFWDDSDSEGSYNSTAASFTMATSTASPIIQSISYAYNSIGNITTLTDTSSTTAFKTIIFTYDDLSRLLTASTTVADSNPFSRSYTYSSLGNITNKSDQGNYTYSETSYANPHAVTDINGTTLAYDNNGNVTSYGNDTYTWNWRDRLTASTVSSSDTYYDYDHNNLRIAKGNSTATTTYANKYYNVKGTTTTKHIYSPDGTLMATIEENGIATTTNYIHIDHLGGTNIVSNESVELVQTLDYYPFGEERISSGTVDEQRKFTGHEHDSIADLTYAKQRYYDQDVGKWLSQDPVFLSVGTSDLAEILKVQDSDEGERQKIALYKYLSDPQSLNSYSYTRNNPVNLVDSDGEYGQLIAQLAPKLASLTLGSIVRPLLSFTADLLTGIDIYEGVVTDFNDESKNKLKVDLLIEIAQTQLNKYERATVDAGEVFLEAIHNVTQNQIDNNQQNNQNENTSQQEVNNN